jgi:hypothetical protein
MTLAAGGRCNRKAEAEFAPVMKKVFWDMMAFDP